ncbi:helix-turn-helix transcriptional regulator [Eubacterium sp. 1001713B170207_170306_E7]|uniref:helix-turn-helix transcriptional regulator n=1 Tax=Eubacterium sp. 1001713B170207_170306_E7 TaxID=2787097 RepID=UPI001899A68E|nr:helix-turn-helix transcriptional regulator [Eubacterium sp. 1001713B170207_170306_E7]
MKKTIKYKENVSEEEKYYTELQKIIEEIAAYERQLRACYGMSQKDIAILIGISQSEVSKLEKKAIFGRKYAYKLHDFLQHLLINPAIPGFDFLGKAQEHSMRNLVEEMYFLNRKYIDEINKRP